MSSRTADRLRSAAFGIDRETVNERMDIAAILLQRTEMNFIGAILYQQSRFFLPARTQLPDSFGIAGLPIVPADIFQFETGLMAFEIFARKIQQWPKPAAHVRF